MTMHKNCEGFSRRDCLKLGLGGLLSGGLIGALRASARAEVSPIRQAKRPTLPSIRVMTSVVTRSVQCARRSRAS